MSADDNFGVMEHICIFLDLYNANPPCQPVPEDLVHSHCHRIARLSRPNEIDMFFLGQIPFLSAHRQNAAGKGHQLLHAVIAVQPF